MGLPREGPSAKFVLLGTYLYDTCNWWHRHKAATLRHNNDKERFELLPFEKIDNEHVLSTQIKALFPQKFEFRAMCLMAKQTCLDSTIFDGSTWDHTTLKTSVKLKLSHERLMGGGAIRCPRKVN